MRLGRLAVQRRVCLRTSILIVRKTSNVPQEDKKSLDKFKSDMVAELTTLKANVTSVDTNLEGLLSQLSRMDRGNVYKRRQSPSFTSLVAAGITLVLVTGLYFYDYIKLSTSDGMLKLTNFFLLWDEAAQTSALELESIDDYAVTISEGLVRGLDLGFKAYSFKFRLRPALIGAWQQAQMDGAVVVEPNPATGIPTEKVPNNLWFLYVHWSLLNAIKKREDASKQVWLFRDDNEIATQRSIEHNCRLELAEMSRVCAHHNSRKLALLHQDQTTETLVKASMISGFFTIMSHRGVFPFVMIIPIVAVALHGHLFPVDTRKRRGGFFDSATLTPNDNLSPSQRDCWKKRFQF